MKEAAVAEKPSLSEWQDQLLVNVIEHAEAADDVVALRFRLVDGGEFPAWAPGAHIDLLLHDGTAEAMVRQYSICGHVEDRKELRIAVLKDPKSRGGSVAVHEQLQPGVQLKIRGPRNNFPLVPAPRYVFFAGGIGITPILPMIRHAEATGTPWTLYYMARTKSRLALLDEISRLPQGNVVLHCDDESGFIDLAGITSRLNADTAVYACGPGPLLDALEKLSLECATWPFHCERFAAAPPVPAIENRPFVVQLAKSGRSLTVPADVSCLKVLREQGIYVDWSCSEGVCGTCETEVLDGIPDHRDAVLTREEREANETMMPCVSRAKSQVIVLNL